MGPLSTPTVFVNCPYDKDFEACFDAIVFTCVACGFAPRSAIDSGSWGTSRIERIVEALRACRYSIHDLSRCRGQGDSNLARFNMPLELGMAMILAHPDRRDHEWMALAPEGAAYEQYASDLSGERHDGDVWTVVRHVAGWLLTRDATIGTPMNPLTIVEALPRYSEAKAILTAKWLGPPPWRELVRAAAEIVDVAP